MDIMPKLNSGSYSITVPTGQQGVMIVNQTGTPLTVQCSLWSIAVPPGAVLTEAVTPNLSITFSFEGVLAGSVDVTYSTASVSMSLVPLQDVSVSISNASIPITGTVDASITNANLSVSGSVDATITNASLQVEAAATFPISGAVDANITNATLDIGTIAGTVAISGDVGIKTGQLVEVTNQAGGSLSVAGTVDATIQNTSLNVDATIQNASLAVTNASDTTLTVDGTVDANITNATLDIGTIAGTVAISGDVGIKAGQLVEVTNESGGALTVGGTVDANIKNATIETNSTILNEQVQESLNYANYVTFTLPTGSNQTITSNIVQIVPAGLSISSLALDIFTQELPSGYAYFNGYITLSMSFQNGATFPIAQLTFSVDTTNFITLSVLPDNQGSPVAFNQISVTIENAPPVSTSTTANVYFIIHGQAQPPNTDTNYPSGAALSWPSQVSDGYLNVATAVPIVAGTVSTDTSNAMGVNGNILTIFGNVVNISGSYEVVTINFDGNNEYFNYQIGISGGQNLPISISFPIPWQPIAQAVDYQVNVSTTTANTVNAYLYVLAI